MKWNIYIIISLISLINISKCEEEDISKLSRYELLLKLGVSKEDALKFLSKTPYEEFFIDEKWVSNNPLDESKLTEKNANWMSRVPDSMNIEKLSIPGTHDTATYSFKGLYFLVADIIDFFARTQRWDLTEQMKAGIRYFDLRPSSNGYIYHGPIKTKTTFAAFWDELRQYMKLYPTEGFIVRIQYSHKPLLCEENCFQKEVIEVLNKNDDIILSQKNIPTMAQLRGKAFIMNNFDYKDAFIWNGDHFVLQDFYDLKGRFREQIDKKKSLVKKYMYDSETDDSLYINHCSATGVKMLRSIKRIANEINSVPYLEEKPFSGTIVFDYPSEELVNRVIRQNNRYFNKNVKFLESN